jgi:hypothetical protein
MTADVCLYGRLQARERLAVAERAVQGRTYRDPKLLSPHNRDVGLRILRTGNLQL